MTLPDRDDRPGNGKRARQRVDAADVNGGKQPRYRNRFGKRLSTGWAPVSGSHWYNRVGQPALARMSRGTDWQSVLRRANVSWDGLAIRPTAAGVGAKG